MKKRILYSTAAILLVLLAWYFFSPSLTPAPQPPLDILSAQNFSDFSRAFNQDTGSVHVVLLVSPT
ncbi:MAG TPA: hypothetical protein VGT03_09835 [Candidatus Acidoferrales bacterium]|nr:hypothetical protein [Candidatus Acidoferrales bacterium]